MLFLAAVVVDGALAGTIYALIALGFVVVYRASRVINFALGEWVMVGARLTAAAHHWLGAGLAPALAAGAAGMVALGVLWNRLVLRRLIGQPLIAFIMVTLGAGAFLRGAATLGFRDVPGTVPLPLPAAPLHVGGLALAADRVAAGLVAAVAIAAVAWFFRRSRTGLALRAIADDQQAAMAVGIDIQRHFSITWGLLGVLAVLAGTLWAAVAGGGFGLVLLGLKVFPIVIIGGLDSVPGTIAGALLVGVLENLASAYLDPLVGGGFGTVATYLALILMLFVRPYGLLGRPPVERV